MEQMRQLAARALRGVRGAATGLGVGGAVRTVIAAGLLAGALPQVMTAPSPAAAATTLGYGMNGGEGKLDMITGMGFGWVKILVAWKQYEPSRRRLQLDRPRRPHQPHQSQGPQHPHPHRRDPRLGVQPAWGEECPTRE